MGVVAVDSSALIAVLFHESGAQALLDAMKNANHLVISAPTLAETAIVFDSRAHPLTKPDDVGILLSLLDISIIPFDDTHASIARKAYLQYGKGRHKAALNMGDCFAYALAKAIDAPLLFKGKDFTQTDIVAAL